MPGITSGRLGAPGMLAIPSVARALGTAGPQFAHRFGRRLRFRSPTLTQHAPPVITGVTRDSSGVALGDCVVQLFRTSDDAIVTETVSDGSGNYAIFAQGTGPFYVVAYKAGAPDVAGTTVNTLQGE